MVIGFNCYLDKNRLSPKLKSYIEKQRKTAYPLLIFASEIKKGEQLKEILQEQFPNEKIGFVSSVTEDRLEQVQAFRDRRTDNTYQYDNLGAWSYLPLCGCFCSRSQPSSVYQI